MNTQVCYFLDIVLEHAFYKICQFKSNACAYNDMCVYVLYRLSIMMQGHIWMQCVCVPNALQEEKES